ncbi:hypothetical protein BH24ACT12_BH24ACT12_15630 [soil metagenome]
MPESRRIDPVERAHLRDAAGYSPPIYRFAPTPALADVVRRFWLPVWSLPNGVRTQQRVLQYPVCLVVVADTYANLVGPTRGLDTRDQPSSPRCVVRWATILTMLPGSSRRWPRSSGRSRGSSPYLAAADCSPNRLVPRSG